MKRTEWGQEREAEFARLYSTLSPEAVSVAIGRSLRSVYSKAHKMGLKSGAPKTPGRVAKPPPKIESRPCLPPSKPAKAAARGPGYLEGEPIRTARTIVTVYERKPDPHRTQTFSQF